MSIRSTHISSTIKTTRYSARCSWTRNRTSTYFVVHAHAEMSGEIPAAKKLFSILVATLLRNTTECVRSTTTILDEHTVEHKFYIKRRRKAQ